MAVYKIIRLGYRNKIITTVYEKREGTDDDDCLDISEKTRNSKIKFTHGETDHRQPV